MNSLMEEEGMYGLKINGNRYDTGNPEEYVNAMHQYFLFSQEKKKEKVK